MNPMTLNAGKLRLASANSIPSHRRTNRASARTPVARAVLEDAGSVLEDLGDHETARAVDLELRGLEADFADAPVSLRPR